jgi:hypothetical protein
MKIHGALQNVDGGMELFEADEAGGVGMQGFDLRIDERSSPFKMRDGGGAIAFAIFENGEHGVAGGIFRMQLQQMIQQRNRCGIAGLIFDLCGALERGDAVWRKFQGVLKGGQRVFGIAFTGISDALQGPKLRIVGGMLQGGFTELDGLVEIAGAKSGADGFGGVLRGAGKSQRGAGQAQKSGDDFPKWKHHKKKAHPMAPRDEDTSSGKRGTAGV